MLIIMGGLPGTGKSSLAKGLAASLRATHIRIDTIEQALRDFGIAPVTSEGYEMGYRLAADNLQIGQTVIADCVNPIEITRTAWLEVGRRCDVRTIQIETICSDREEHKARIQSRESDIAGLVLPTWEMVLAREYEAWTDADLIIDTTAETPQRSLQKTLALLREKIGER
ncbi:MAG: AAA family ATPase [Pseudomonadota bacterium]